MVKTDLVSSSCICFSFKWILQFTSSKSIKPHKPRRFFWGCFFQRSVFILLKIMIFFLFQAKKLSENMQILWTNIWKQTLLKSFKVIWCNNFFMVKWNKSKLTTIFGGSILGVIVTHWHNKFKSLSLSSLKEHSTSREKIVKSLLP